MSERKRYGVQRDQSMGWQVVDADNDYEPVARCWGRVPDNGVARANAMRIARLLNDEEDMRAWVNQHEERNG